MTKEEVKSKLKKAGYQVVDDNSIVTILISEKASIKNTIKDVKEKFSMWGYECSFGIKQVKMDTEAQKKESDEANDSEEFDEDAPEFEAQETEEQSEDVSKPSVEDKLVNGKTAEEESLDEADDDSLASVIINEEDMDMILGEDNIQFSLEDFGMNF